MKTKQYLILAIATLAVLAALSTTASAGDYGYGCPFHNWYNGTIHGGVYFDVHGGYDGTGGPQTGIFVNVPDNRTIVRFYPGIWLGSRSDATIQFTITTNGHADTYSFQDHTGMEWHEPTGSWVDPPVCQQVCEKGNPDSPDCTVDITGCGCASITCEGSPYIVTGNNTIIFECTGEIYQFALLAVYEDPSMPEAQYWIKEGHEYPDFNYSVYFNETVNTGPINTSSLQSVTYWTYGYPHCPGNPYYGNITLNGHELGEPDKYGYGGAYDVMYRWTSEQGNIFPSYVSSPSNHFYYDVLSNDRMMVPVFILQYGELATDTTPPYTTGHDPAKDAADVPDTNIIVHVKDSGTGVDQNTIVMTVGGMEVTPARTGDKYDYTLTYDPLTDFDYGQVVDVTVDAADLNETPNVMTTDSYSFTIMELEPATPFLIYGWVNYDNGDPVNDPLVNVTNLNTTEIYEVKTMTTSNYYQVLTCSDNVSIGDVLHFYASAETTTEFDYTVTDADMNRGGFEQNITIEKTPRPDLMVSEINAYHNATGFPPYFNLSNEIDVTVENAGAKAANSSHVSLYIDGEFSGKLSVPALDVGSNATVQFKWTPTGYDCEDEGTSITYTLKAVADCDNEIEESNEGNNESTVQETAYWAGYSADEVLNTVFNGTIHGGLKFTTGDGIYTPLGSPGASTDIHYDITLPDSASVELARLNVYYTWSKTGTTGVYPSMEVSITNTSGTYTLSSVVEYNDRPCDSPAISYDYPFGNYVYNITEYINGSGSYTVTVKNNGPTGHSFAIDPPGLVILYNDTTKPEYKYWILEGADILEGGRRGGGGNLALSECINLATFEGTIDLNKMESATLGLATPWGGNPTAVRHSYLYFNGNELGKDVYHGYSSQYSKTLNGMSMHIGSTNAQIGVNLTDVTGCLAASNNIVGQGDDGDSMMVANAFLMVERKGDDVANADIEVKGTKTGSYEDTHASDGVYEAITEIESKGKPDNRYSYLEHKWTIDVTGGSSVTFYVEAYRTDSGEGDNFNFSYSTDDSIYTDMVTVTKTTDDGTCQTYELPSNLSGTVYIRVKDTDQTAGNKTLDTIYIDHIFIRSVLGPPDTTAPAAVADLAASDSTSSSIMLTWTAPGDDGNTGTANSYDIRYSTSTITEDNWGSATQCTGEPAPQPAGSSETFTVTVLDANTTYYFALKTSDEVPNESPLSNVANNTTTEAAANTMHVASIDMSLKTAGPNTNAIALVTIVDATDAPVGGATVEGHWSNATSDTDSGTTDASGQVSLNSDKVKNAPSGTNFTFTVDNVVKDGWTWDGDKKSGSITYYK